MPKHEIDARLPAHTIANVDVRFLVNSDGVLLGELKISKGSLDWRPAKHQYSRRLSWEKFASLIEEHGSK